MKSRSFAALVLCAATVAATVLTGTARAADTGPDLIFDEPTAGVPDLMFGEHFKPGVTYVWTSGLGSFATATTTADPGGVIKNFFTLPADAVPRTAYTLTIAVASTPAKPVYAETDYVQAPYTHLYVDQDPWHVYAYTDFPASEKVDLTLDHVVPGFPRSIMGGQSTGSIPVKLGAQPEVLTLVAVGETYRHIATTQLTLAGNSVVAPHDFGYESTEQEAILATSTTGYSLQAGGDGQLQVVSWRNGARSRNPVWSSPPVGHNGRPAVRPILQSDGNLVLYSGAPVLWSTRTAGTGPHNRLSLQTDGNLVLRDAAGDALWSSKTGRINASQLLAGRTLYSGAQLIAGRYNAHLTAAGRLGVVGVRSWQSLAAGKNSTLTLQSDGNLVLRSAAGKAVWASGTAGTKATRLIMQPDGNLVLRTARGAGVWQSHTA